eukprot:TRINITY_DN1416_c0_g1_i10.p1 TRINITY_DN1416_c0_g1~~TRINITY_DN1416_c0_g1_i10.p1  ORF type:complete len:406 (-),score=125.03 TRINITY_DN1416_c0_g1_i10:353-1510(-)
MAPNVPLRQAEGQAAHGSFDVEDPRNVAPKPASSGAGANSGMMQLGLFLFFTMSRAIHPLIIEESKVEITTASGKKSGFAYESISVPLMECVVTLIVAQGMCLMKGGVAEWREIWKPAPMSVFSAIGFVYAFGDYLELMSLGSLSGVMYQVLSQTKLIVTAFMIWGIKGQKQSTLQWILLTLLMLSLICYSLMKSLLAAHAKALASGGAEEAIVTQEGSVLAFGMLMAVLKVTVSCLCAVLSDKYMKDYKDEPIYMQLVQFKVSWFVTLLVLATVNGGDKFWSEGLLHDWSPAVVASLASFTVKGWSTMYLLAILDSMLKNLGEACTVLVTYFLAVAHPGKPDVYDFEAFMTLLVVFVCVVAYLAAKDVVTKAQKYDEAQKKIGA